MAGMTKRERIKAALAEGCDGVFLSTRFASYELMNEEEYRRFGRPGDTAVLAAASEGGWFNVFQMHGQRLIVTTGCTYPLGVPHSNLLAMRKAV